MTERGNQPQPEVGSGGEAPAAPAPLPASRGAILAARGLVVLASVLAVVAIFAVWINRQALNTDDWVDTSSQLLQDQRIRTELGGYLVDQLYANVDVAGELRSTLPKDLRPLAAPAAGGLRQVLGRVADEALKLPQVQQLWRDANRVAHRNLVAVIDNRTRVLRIQGRTVFLDLRPLVTQLASRAGLGADVASKLPADAAHLRILSSRQVQTAQRVARALHGLMVLLLIVVPALYGVAVLLAAGSRRRMLLACGIGLAAAALLVIVIRRVAGNYVVDALTNSGTVRPAAEATWSIGTSILSDVAISALVMGVALVTAAWVAGPGRAAVAIRRAVAPPMRDHLGYVYGVVAALLLLLLVWAPIHPMRKPLFDVVVVVAVVVGVELLRHQVAREFPAQPGVAFSDLMRDGMARMRTAVGRVRKPAVAGDAETATALNRVAVLERLADLHDRGALTDEEFAAQKAALLPPAHVG